MKKKPEKQFKRLCIASNTYNLTQSEMFGQILIDCSIRSRLKRILRPSHQRKQSNVDVWIDSNGIRWYPIGYFSSDGTELPF